MIYDFFRSYKFIYEKNRRSGFLQEIRAFLYHENTIQLKILHSIYSNIPNRNIHSSLHKR